MRIIYILIFSLFVVNSNHVGAMLLSDKATAVGIALVTNVDLYKKQQTDLEKNLAELKKRYDDASKSLTNILNKIALDTTGVQSKLQGAVERDADYLNKKMTILNDRRQILSTMQEMWKELLDRVDDHSKVLIEIVTFLQTSRVEPKSAYAWKDFRDAQLRVTEYVAKIESDRERQESTTKQLAAARERLASLEKQQAAKTKEREKLIAHADSLEKTGQYDSTTLKYDADILDQQLSVLSENIDLVNLLIEKLAVEQRMWNDVVILDRYKLNDQNEMLKQIESRLILDFNDVDIAKTAWKNETQNAYAIKELLNKQRDSKKEQHEKVVVELKILREKINKMRAMGQVKSADYIRLKVDRKILYAQAQTLMQELAVLDAKKDVADARASEKELQFNMVELRYKLKTETEKIDELLSVFQNKKELALSVLNSFREKRNAAITTLIETNRDLDKLKGYREKVAALKNTQFKGKEHQYTDILNLLSKIRDYCSFQLKLIQTYLAVNADVITHQEKIINHYNLILNELEARQRTISIWKRSPHAISFEVLVRSVLEVEAFFKKLYWETPTNFKPTTVWTGLKALTWYDYVLLLASVLFYLLFFVFAHAFLVVIRRRLGGIVEQYKEHVRYLYFHLILAVIDFALNYFTLLFTWLFLFLHVYFDFDYIFQGLGPLATSYSIALFYVLSIPTLVYLASGLVKRLEVLNAEQSYRFLPESFQQRFIWLITIVGYATAILLPLRMAILAYADFQYAESATVLLAAYSLILLVVILLLFAKDDVLRLLPSNTSFLIWFKRKIDKYYYPVFSFVMGLMILSNPYIGYANMAWFMAFAIPTTFALIYLLFTMHFYIRKYAVFMFMKEDDEEIVDKFEHAKAYYGLFVIFSFVALLFLTFILVMRVWGIIYTIDDIWKALSETWIIYIGDSKVGLIEFMLLGLFVAGGFVISSVIEKFVLNKLFDILRSEPGTQNTITRLVHYTVIFIVLVLGLSKIHLAQFIFWIGASFSIALGWALRDIILDWVAGFLVLIERPIEIGNYIQIDNDEHSIEGTIHKIAARSTTIITSRNHSVIIPNRDLVNKQITNWGHGRFAVGFEMSINVEPTSDPDQVKKTLIQVVQTNPLILRVPGIVVRMENIDENGAFNYLVRAFISARRVKEQWEIAAALRADIVKVFREAGIVLARPARVVQLEKSKKGIAITFDK